MPTGSWRAESTLHQRTGQELPDRDSGNFGEVQCGRPSDLEADARTAAFPNESVYHKRRQWQSQNQCLIEGGSEDVGMDIFERGLCLPSDNKMTAEEQNVVIEIIRRCFE